MSANIDGVENVEKKLLTGKKRVIVICENRGLTMVGDVNFNLFEESSWALIENARCIVRWGTTKHIAEIVNGPTSKTILGEEKDFWVRIDKIVGAYVCGDGWNG